MGLGGLIDVADNFGITLKEVIIHKLQDGVFFSVLVCEKDGEEQVLDARTSDAVALAIRFQCPVYTYKEILEKAGVILKEGNDTRPKAEETEERTSSAEVEEIEEAAPASELKSKSTKELYAILDKAVKDENYELAARVRDEIAKRSAN